ncbi:MAG: magnesium/cobalt transporter CorA [Actinomycetota bacterium]
MSVAHLATGPAAPLEAERAEVERRLAAGEFFWLDVTEPEEHDTALLGEMFGFHPLALEDSLKFGQRPKIEEYDGFAYIVVFGAAHDADRLVEVHCFYSERCLVTVHRDDCPPFADLRRRQARHAAQPPRPIELLHQVVDVLTDSFFPALDDLEDAIDAIEDRLDGDASTRQQQDIYALKRRALTLRKVIGPQRDLVARIAGETVELPGLTPDAVHYFRDVYDHLIRLGDLIETHRDLLAGATEVYLSTVSNRLNAIMKQLTLIATIFLPLTFVTGFFGQNFGWMVDHVGSLWAFLLFGLAGQLVVLVALVAWFRRRGWL